MSKADVSSPGGVAVDDLGEIGSLLVAAMKAIAEARPLKIGHLEAVHDALRAAALRDPQLKHVRKAIRVGLTLNDALGVPPSQEQRDTILKAWFYLYAVCRLITRDLSQLSVEDKPLEACCQCEAISWAIEYLEQLVALWRDSWKTTWRIGHPEEDMPVTSSLPTATTMSCGADYLRRLTGTRAL